MKIQEDRYLREVNRTRRHTREYPFKGGPKTPEDDRDRPIHPVENKEQLDT
jgi:hypothetical protein